MMSGKAPIRDSEYTKTVYLMVTNNALNNLTTNKFLVSSNITDKGGAISGSH
jgi:hypothetical protein